MLQGASNRDNYGSLSTRSLTPTAAGHDPPIGNAQCHTHNVDTGNREPLETASVNYTFGPHVTRRVCISHFLSSFNSRIFEFGAVLFLTSIFPESLMEMSLYALARTASAFALAPVVGYYIDRGNRLKVVTTSIVGQRGAVAASCIGFWLLALDNDSIVTLQLGTRRILIIGLFLLACVEKLCALMNTVAIERGWVVIIAEGNESQLQALNSQMRQIDLFCKLLGPLAISVVDEFSTKFAIWLVFVSSVISLPVEYFAIAKVYNIVPALQVNRYDAESQLPSRSPLDTDNDAAQSHESSPLLNRSLPRWFPNPTNSVRSLYKALVFYTHHPAFIPSFSVSLLYLTVLSFAGQMIAYLIFTGFTSTQIGFLRTVTVGFEMSATWIAPLVMRKIGTTRAGLWFVNWQVICLAIAANCFLWGGKSNQPFLAAWGLIAGVMLSRVGLWGFDLCVQVLIQEEVDQNSSGLFSSIEASFQNLFELCSFSLTVIFAKPSQFRYPVMVSITAVFIAGCLYAGFVRKRRGHLFHMKCGGIKRRGNIPRERRQVQGEL